MGDSKAIYSMAKSNMLPNNFAKLNSNSTPAFGIILGEVLCTISPFFGKPALIWLVDASGFGYCIAYFIVSLSFVKLRIIKPNMERPFKVKHWRFVGIVSCVMSLFLIILYIVPLLFSSSAFVWQEWIVAGAWILIGVVFFFISKNKYHERFGEQHNSLED